MVAESPKRCGGLLIRRSLRFQLLLTFGIITVGSQTILLVTSYSSSFSLAKEQARDVAQSELREASLRIDRLLNAVERETVLLAQNTAVQSALRRQKDTDRVEDYDDYRLLRASVLAAEQVSDVWNVRLFLTGTRRYFSDNDTVFTDFRELEAAGLLEHQADDQAWWTMPYHYERAGGEPRLIVSHIRRVYDNVNVGALLGLVAFDLPVDQIAGLVALADVLPSASVVMRDGDGNQLLRLSGDQLPTSSNPGPLISLTEQNSSYKLIASVYLAPYSRRSMQIVRRLMIVGVLVLLGTAGATIILSETITRRLRLVSVAMETIEHADFRREIEVQGQDEVAQLAGHFNQMVGRIRRLIDDVYRARLRSTNAELSVLRAQINPHFLYNALDGISWMATRQGAGDVVEAVQELSRFLRLSLSRVHEHSTVAEEVEHARVYFTIQRFRFEDRISFSVLVSPSIGQLSIIPLILQPLVENAVVHGILAEAGRTGRVSIHAELFENSVFLRVSDDGLGISPDQLQSVRSSFYCEEEPGEPDGHGLGLASIARRIRYRYGSNYGVDIESEPGAGTTVTVSFPAIGVALPTESRPEVGGEATTSK